MSDNHERDELARIYAEHWGEDLRDIDDKDWQLFDRILAAGFRRRALDVDVVEQTADHIWTFIHGNWGTYEDVQEMAASLASAGLLQEPQPAGQVCRNCDFVPGICQCEKPSLVDFDDYVTERATCLARAVIEGGLSPLARNADLAESLSKAWAERIVQVVADEDLLARSSARPAVDDDTVERVVSPHGTPSWCVNTADCRAESHRLDCPAPEEILRARRTSAPVDDSTVERVARAADQLAEFHEALDQPYGYGNLPADGLEDVNLVKLRRTLHSEEHQQLDDALLSGTHEEIAQELADVVYVAYGTAHLLGIPLDAVIDEVHRANMSKVGSDGKFVLREDGKVLKPPSFRPPDVAGVLSVRAAVRALAGEDPK